MKGPAAEVRALALQSCLLGFAAMQRAVPNRTLEPRHRRMLRERLRVAIEVRLAM